MNLKQRLGAKIRFLRKSRKYSQEYFSELIGINPRQIVRIENGENMPSVENLEKIAKIFDITIDELFMSDSFDNNDVLCQKIKDKLTNLNNSQLRTLYLICMSI